MLDQQDYRIQYIPPGGHDALREMAVDLLFLAALLLFAVALLFALAQTLPLVAL